MAAIISDKFRIYNAEQFLTALGDDYYDLEGLYQTGAGVERSRIYFFVGRPQPWDASLEIYSAQGSFQVGETVYVGANLGAATFAGIVREVLPESLLVHTITGSSGVNSAPVVGSTLTGNTSSATAKTGVYRYGTEDTPTTPLDNQTETNAVYDDIVAAKRVTIEYARAVIRRFNWTVGSSQVYDMYKPDYSSNTTGQTGKPGSSTAQTSAAGTLGEAKFYVMNRNYEVWKCLYNGTTVTNPNGVVATNEPSRTPSAGQGTYDAVTGLFTEAAAAPGQYIWKFLYAIPTNDVLRFLSTDFMPVALPSDASRQATEALAALAPDAIDVVVVENDTTSFGGGSPFTYYAPIIGDGSDAIVEISGDNGQITSALVIDRGQGYTYASVPLVSGTTVAGNPYGVFSDQALTTPVTVTAGTGGALEPIISPAGGHGSNMEQELNAKRVMTNIRLAYAEGEGDFPVDNDFRRIGLIKDPIKASTDALAEDDTLSNLRAVRLENVTSDFVVDETISQDLGAGGANGTAYGTVVSWTLDAPGGTTGTLKYFQHQDYHTDFGVVRAFESDAINNNPIVGATSLAEGDVDTADNSTTLGMTFTNGLHTPEIKPLSGQIIYLENRRLITRAPDQIEDIKLVIEF